MFGLRIRKNFETSILVTCLILLGSVFSTVTGQQGQVHPHYNYTGVQGVTYCRDSNPNFGEVIAVFETDCARVPCSVRTDRKYTALFEIIPYEDHQSLEMVGTVMALGKEIKLPGQNACELLAFGAKCPIQKGQRYVFAISPDIPKLMPQYIANFLRGQTVQVNILGSLEDKNTGSKICIAVPQQVTFV